LRLRSLSGDDFGDIMMHKKNVQLVYWHAYAGAAAIALVFVLAPLEAAGQADAPSRQDDVRRALLEGEHERALALASEAVAAHPQDAAARMARAAVYDTLRRHSEAIADYDAALRVRPDDAHAHHLRGRSRFKAGDVKGSVEDFDRAAELDASLAPRLWERGISYYYAKEFAKGARQFEAYQTYDASDVENVVWRYICQARSEGIEPARKDIMPLDREDRRVPLMKVYALYRGEATPDDVLSAAREGNPDETDLRHRLFYAHLYLALYFEANSDDESAKGHMRLAHEQKISHYMWDVADVHLKERGWAADVESSKPQP
jgi:lipoprotein NlpI